MGRSWEDWYADEKRDLVRAAAEHDPALAKWVQRRRLPFIGLGSSSVVFGLGPEHVLRVTHDGGASVGDDCGIPEYIFEKHRGQLAGWPRVDDVFFVEDKEDDHCITVVERVRVGDTVASRDWTPLLAAVDAVYTVHALQGSVQARLRFEGIDPGSDAARWAKELSDGLKNVGRWKSPVPLDAGEGNFGLTRDRRAVWVDFGV